MSGGLRQIRTADILVVSDRRQAVIALMTQAVVQRRPVSLKSRAGRGASDATIYRPMVSPNAVPGPLPALQGDYQYLDGPRVQRCRRRSDRKSRAGVHIRASEPLEAGQRHAESVGGVR
jgi:hypothetical protein